MKTYYQGDTIKFNVAATEGPSLADVDFVVNLYPAGAAEQNIRIGKEEMAAFDNRSAFQGVVPAERSRTMSIGVYVAELLIRRPSGDCCIARAEAFRLEESVSKHYIS